MPRVLSAAALSSSVLAHCHAISKFTEEPGKITRTFLSSAMRACYEYLGAWMRQLGLQVWTDAAGNLRGLYNGTDEATSGRLLIGSHLDTVPDAGPYDGVLGVTLAIALIEQLAGEHLPFGIEVIGFSEEEGVRFGTPFIGSRALVGDLDECTLLRRDISDVSIRGAIERFGLDPRQLGNAESNSSHFGYLEFHIEQGPALESLGLPLAIVQAIAGQSRAEIRFVGQAGHAGTTPMLMRSDALCAAADWITYVECIARSTEGLVATVGQIAVRPGASNVIPGEVRTSLDVRHACDRVRTDQVNAILHAGRDTAAKRNVGFASALLNEQNAVPMNAALSLRVERALAAAEVTPHRLTSGAGHDAMVLATRLPSAMIFLRSPGGISHHPDERVLEADVALALEVGHHLLQDLCECPFRI